ncbi:MAG: hypothetical protein JJU28_09420 [Cyclobacteriaceae bacterium]|nr:hypothetical protein [Cyclobacteriaceae bacterium]
MDGLTNFYNNSSNKVATDVNPWAEVEFDNSPFSRVKRAGSYGTNWQLNVDEDFKNPVVGFTRVSKSANGDWEKLESNFTASEAGHLFVYVSNEGKEDVNIYFDDFIIMSRSAVTALQIDDYYPYGLPIKPLAYKDPDISHINRFMYQTKYWYDDGISPLEVYDFHARMYACPDSAAYREPVLGRFLGVDPQNQFASPYTGMGNNPVMMVDPDGEFAFVAAAFLVKKAVVALKAAKVAKGLTAAGKAAAGVGKAAKASKFATVMGKATSTKGITTGLKSGAINTISNFDSDEGLGWNTLGDFAAGFAGGSIGYGSESKLIGMGIGGLGTWAVNGASFDYQGGQEFVGGALSTFVGMNGAVKGKHTLFKEAEGVNTLVKFKNKNIFTKTLMNHGDNFIKYGLQNNAYDFAYTKEEDFRKRKGGHLDLFLWGGASGAFQQSSFFFADEADFSRFPFGARMEYQAIDWAINGWIKKRYDGFKIDGNKALVNYFKWNLWFYGRL